VVIRLTTVKGLLWLIAILLLALSFPLQVYSGNPYPSLLPYLVIGVIILVASLAPKNDSLRDVTVRRNHNIALMVGVYVFLIFLNTGWQAAFGVISASEAMTALVIYLLPVVFYLHFRRAAQEEEIRWVLLAIVVAGLIVGAYFAYDSFLKLALGQVSEYAKMAFQYSLDRAGITAEEANKMRVSYGYRSLGLLESHSVSGSWVILGALAALALMPLHRRFLRRCVILVFGIMLLLGLNFTAIVAFFIIMSLFEFGGITLLRGRITTAIWRDSVSIALILGLMVGAALWVAGDLMSTAMGAVSLGQIDMILGRGQFQESVIGKTMSNVAGYFQHVSNVPFTLVLGDGFSSYGLLRGGGCRIRGFHSEIWATVLCGDRVRALALNHIRIAAKHTHGQ